MDADEDITRIRSAFDEAGFDLMLTQTTGGVWEARWVEKGQPVTDWPVTNGVTRLDAAERALTELRAEEEQSRGPSGDGPPSA